MSTDLFTTHKHTQSKISGGTTASAGSHAHTTTTIDQELAAIQGGNLDTTVTLKSLAARLTILEALAAPPAPTGLTATPGNGLVSLAWAA